MRGGGWIRLIVGFQPLMVISPTASEIWCMQVYACELMWTCLVWAERSTPDNFLVPNHRFKSATGEQKGITETIYTDSELPSRMPKSLMPSAKLRSANLPFFTSLVWRGRVLADDIYSCSSRDRIMHSVEYQVLCHNSRHAPDWYDRVSPDTHPEQLRRRKFLLFTWQTSPTASLSSCPQHSVSRR